MPLVVTDANASCGCTVPEKPEKPILPGEMGFIKIVFDIIGRIVHLFNIMRCIPDIFSGIHKVPDGGD